MIIVYVLKSVSSEHYYVGMTQNLERRLSDHNQGWTKSNKAFAPFILLYTETWETREIARKREKYLKSSAGRSYLKKINIRPRTRLTDFNGL